MAAKKQLKKTAATPISKINKNAKLSEIESPVVTDEIYRCSCCGHKYPKQEGNFNVSKSPIYAGNNGYVTICKKCLYKLFEQYVKFFDKDEYAAAERICQITDMVLDDDAWDASRKITANRNRMSTYISKLNLKQTEGETYSDTLIRRWEAQVENAESIESAANNSDIQISKETIQRFGLGFDDNAYKVMENEYNSWVDKYGEPIDKRQEELYTSMCYLKYNLQQSVQNNNASIGPLANSYKGYIEAATTEIEDRNKKAEVEVEVAPLGMLIRDIENYCPAEFYKDKKLYADFDKLKEYITRFMARPLRNILTGSKELDKEYNLSGSEEL